MHTEIKEAEQQRKRIATDKMSDDLTTGGHLAHAVVKVVAGGKKVWTLPTHTVKIENGQVSPEPKVIQAEFHKVWCNVFFLLCYDASLMTILFIIQSIVRSYTSIFIINHHPELND